MYITKDKMQELKLSAFEFIQELESSLLDKSELRKKTIEATYRNFMQNCETIMKNAYRKKYTQKSYSLINVTSTIMWVVNLVNAIKAFNEELADSAARKIIHIMKGNYDV